MNMVTEKLKTKSATCSLQASFPYLFCKFQSPLPCSFFLWQSCNLWDYHFILKTSKPIIINTKFPLKNCHHRLPTPTHSMEGIGNSRKGRGGGGVSREVQDKLDFQRGRRLLHVEKLPSEGRDFWNYTRWYKAKRHSLSVFLYLGWFTDSMDTYRLSLILVRV